MRSIIAIIPGVESTERRKRSSDVGQQPVLDLELVRALDSHLQRGSIAHYEQPRSIHSAAVASPVCIVGATGALGFGLALRLGRAGVPIVIGSRDAGRAAGGRGATPPSRSRTVRSPGCRTRRPCGRPRSWS